MARLVSGKMGQELLVSGGSGLESGASRSRPASQDAAADDLHPSAVPDSAGVDDKGQTSAANSSETAEAAVFTLSVGRSAEAPSVESPAADLAVAPAAPDLVIALPAADESGAGSDGGGLFTSLLVSPEPTADGVVTAHVATGADADGPVFGCCCPACTGTPVTGDVVSTDPEPAAKSLAPDGEIDWSLPQYTRAPGSGDIEPMNGNSEPWEYTLGNPPVYTGDNTIDGVLWGTNWSDGGISYSDPDATGDYQAGYFSTAGQPNYSTGFGQLTANQLTVVHAVLNDFQYTQLSAATGLSVEAFTGLSITYAGAGTGSSTIRLANTSSTVVSTARVADFPGGNIHAGDVWFGGSGDNPTTGNYDYATVIHELGHALGLKHGHQASNEFGAGAPVLPGATDSMEYSIMTYRSYVGGGTSGYTNETWGYAQTWMMYDIRALQEIYGADFGANSGNTVYSWSPTSGNTLINGSIALQPGGNKIFATLWDGDGIDTYDLSAYTSGVNIDLTPGGHSVFSFAQLADLNQFSAGFEASGNIYNALQYNGDARSLIENAIGGTGNDTLLGNAANNSLVGGSGNDNIEGGSGNDTVDGGTGSDTLSGGLGDDLYIVDNIGDVAAEVAGGVDTVESSVTHTLSVNLENLTLTGSASINGTGNDSRANVIVGNGANNLLSGLGLNDDLSGGSGEDTLLGGTGNDTLAGGSGVDSINGGDGDDLILFTSGHFYDNVDGGTGTDTLDATAVTRNGDTFDFELGIISGYPGGQTVTGIEIFQGGQGDETIVSDGLNHSYFGNGGNDYMIAEIGGETMDGGAGGTDTIDLSRWSGGYTVDMTTGSSNYGGELYTNFENLVSGAGDDSITGTAGNNDIRTTGGNDTVVAGGGEDTVYGGDGNDLLQGGFVTDFIYGEAGDDTIQVLNGEFFDNSDGGDGFDTLDHSASDYSGTTFDFEAQLISGAGVNAPAFVRNIELYLDGSGDNTIVSNGESRTYYGNGGNDYMIAEIGGETMDGGVGGTDTIDLSRWSGVYVVDMTTGSSNYSNELFTNFENLVSGAGNDSITGTTGINVITTQDGNDSINAGAGNDTVFAGAGDDVITDTESMFSGGSEDDVYDGGSGTDTLIHELNWNSTVTFDLNAGWSMFAGNRDQLISIENLVVGGNAVVIGSAVDNVLTVNGTGANNISGLGGNDQIFAGGGNDTVSGGDGNDSIEGGAGTDEIDGGNGDDAIRILDGEFIDNVVGGAGTDTLNMTAVTTAIVFNALTGTYQGSVGGDAQRTHSGIDVFRSGSAGDTIYSNGAGEYYGNDGNDTMYAGLGTPEVIDGGNGIDTLDTTSFGGGFSYTLDMNTGLTNYAGELFTNFENVVMGATTDTVLGTAGDNAISTQDGNDTLNGGDGNDTLDGGAGADAMEGGAGDDTFGVDDAGDVVTDASGNDTVLASVDYTLTAGLETLILVGTAFSGTGNTQDNLIVGTSLGNALYGVAGNDTLLGLDGGDYLDGGTGSDYMEGGDGDDTYVVDDAGDAVSEADTVLSGTFDVVYSSITYTLGTGLEHLVLQGASVIDGTGNEKDNIIYGNDAVNVLTGLDGSDYLAGFGSNDSLLGGNGNDTLDGGTGADSMEGGDGDDTYYVDTNGDLIIEMPNMGFESLYSTVLTYTAVNNIENIFLVGAGNQSVTGNWSPNLIVGQAGDNLIEGLSGPDTIYGGDGNDSLYGGPGIDELYGEAGDDTLEGGGSSDSALVGGTGNDLYFVNYSSDVVIELAGEGYDIVNSTSEFFTLPENVEDLAHRSTSGVQNGKGNALGNIITGVGANDNFSGLDGNDYIESLSGNDTLRGDNGNDTLLGGADNDSLIGGAGNDSMAGGGGNDTLRGDSGADSLLGGTGDDYYVDVFADDVLTEFGNAGYDRVFAKSSITLGANFEYLELTGGGNTGTGNNLDNVLIGNANNNTLSGLFGADSIYGKQGSDTLYAGVDALQDRFIFDTALNAATNVDTLYEAEFPEDQLMLDNSVFGNLLSTGATNTGTLGAGFYFEGSGLTGGGTSDAIGIWYDLATGRLYYNPTAGIGGDSTLFAIVDGASDALDSVDFTLFSAPLAAAGGVDAAIGLLDDGVDNLATPTFFTATPQDTGYTVV
jgi:serralysin